METDDDEELEMFESSNQVLPSPLKPIGHERRQRTLTNNSERTLDDSHDLLDCEELVFKFDPITVKGIFMQEVKELNHRIKQTQILWAEKPVERRDEQQIDEDDSSAFDHDVQESLLDFLAEQSENTLCKRQRTC